MMRIVNFDHQVGDRKLQLMRPEFSGLVLRRQPMPLAEEEQDVRDLSDDAVAGLEERRRIGGCGSRLRASIVSIALRPRFLPTST
jgi:hypothetical protein